MEQEEVKIEAYLICHAQDEVNILQYEGWNFNSGNYLFTTDTK